MLRIHYQHKGCKQLSTQHVEFTELSNPEFREMLAERIRALGEATRIHLLQYIMEKERSVNELVQLVDKSQATVSKHLSILHRHGYIKQRKHGVQTLYSSDSEGLSVFCQFMCTSLKEHLKHLHEAVYPRETAMSK